MQDICYYVPLVLIVTSLCILVLIMSIIYYVVSMTMLVEGLLQNTFPAEAVQFSPGPNEGIRVNSLTLKKKMKFQSLTSRPVV